MQQSTNVTDYRSYLKQSQILSATNLTLHLTFCVHNFGLYSNHFLLLQGELEVSVSDFFYLTQANQKQLANNFSFFPFNISGLLAFRSRNQKKDLMATD